MRFRRYVLILFLSLPLLCCAGGKSGLNLVVEPLPQYDALFSNKDGWTGADGAYSVALKDHRIAWFFGDTWIGQIKNGQHINATLVNNSAAIQHGQRPAEAEMSFYFGRAGDGSPAALIQPADGRGFFWIFDGVMTAKGLVLFLIQVERTAGDAVFDFKVIGVWLGLVENPGEPPSAWRVRQSRIPWSDFSAAGGILWGSAVLQIEDDLYIYGTAEDGRSSVHRKTMVLARVAASVVEDYSRWRFFAEGNWVSDFRQADRLGVDVPHEYSVSYLSALDQYVVVYSQDGLSKDILARLASHPQGPWSDPLKLYECPEAAWDPSIFCYAAKAHAVLSAAPDQLVITYVANSVDFDRTASDARLYRPRFIRVTFSAF